MEKFTFNKNTNESLCIEAVHRTHDFLQGSRIMLEKDFLSIELINKILDAVSLYRDLLAQVSSKNNEEYQQVKSTLQELVDLGSSCNQRKTLH